MEDYTKKLQKPGMHHGQNDLFFFHTWLIDRRNKYFLHIASKLLFLQCKFNEKRKVNETKNRPGNLMLLRWIIDFKMIGLIK